MKKLWIGPESKSEISFGNLLFFVSGEQITAIDAIKDIKQINIEGALLW